MMEKAGENVTAEVCKHSHTVSAGYSATFQAGAGRMGVQVAQWWGGLQRQL